MTKAEKQLDKVLNSAIQRALYGKPVDIMDLSKIRAEGLAVLANLSALGPVEVQTVLEGSLTAIVDKYAAKPAQLGRA